MSFDLKNYTFDLDPRDMTPDVRAVRLSAASPDQAVDALRVFDAETDRLIDQLIAERTTARKPLAKRANDARKASLKNVDHQ